jgi:hypothetical protein
MSILTWISNIILQVLQISLGYQSLPFKDSPPIPNKTLPTIIIVNGYGGLNSFVNIGPIEVTMAPNSTKDTNIKEEVLYPSRSPMIPPKNTKAMLGNE